jgi:integrase
LARGAVAEMNLRDDSWRALNKALSRAVSDGLILRNAVTSVKPPQPRRAEIRPLDREQVRALFKAVSGYRLEALYVVAVTAGLRQGELLGLRWEDVGYAVRVT